MRKRLATFLALLLLLATGTDAILVRITNIYYGVYLKPDLSLTSDSSTDYWLFENGVISSRDRAYFLCVDSTNKLLLLSSSSTGAITQWDYDNNKMALSTTSAGATVYLSLNDTTAGTAPSHGTRREQVLISTVPGSGNSTLAEKLRESLKQLKEKLGTVRQKFGDIDTFTDHLVSNASILSTAMASSEEDYSHLVTQMTESLEDLNETLVTVKSDILNAIAVINTKQVNMETKDIPYITSSLDKLLLKPDNFLEKLKTHNMDDMLRESLSPVNNTLGNYLNRHRVIPVAPYDWLILVTAILSCIYFTDLLLRVAGIRCRNQRTGPLAVELIETASMKHISPEYYLQEGEHTNFETAKQNIKGKLQLKRADEF